MKRKSVSILPLCTPSIGAVDKELLVSIEKNSEAFIKAIQAKYPQTKYYFVEGEGGPETLSCPFRNRASDKKTSRKLG